VKLECYVTEEEEVLYYENKEVSSRYRINVDEICRISLFFIDIVYRYFDDKR